TNHFFGVRIALPHGVISLAKRLTRLASPFMDGFGRLLSILAKLIAGLRRKARTLRGGIVQESLDGIPSFPGLALNEADQMVDIAVKRLQIVVGQLSPFLAKLPLDLVPISLKHLLIDHCETPFRLFCVCDVLTLGLTAPG